MNGTLEVVFDRVEETGRALTIENTEFFIHRNGITEQTYFTWSCIPIYDNDDNLVSFYSPMRETTRLQVLYRRVSLLLGLSESLGKAVLFREYWQNIIHCLESGDADVPFLLLYGLEDISRTQAEAADMDFILHGTLGYPTDLAGLPHQLNLHKPEEDFAIFSERFRDAQEPILISTTDGSFPTRMLTTIHTRSFSEECTQAICCPIRPSLAGSAVTVGFFILGINPRRPYDDEYRLFIHLMTSQLSSFMASTLLFQEIVQQGRQDKSLLTNKLANQVKLTENSEERYQRIADHVPIAMFNFRVDGTLDYANEEYYRLMPDANNLEDFMEAIRPDYQALARAKSQSLGDNSIPAYMELQLKKPWRSPENDEGFVWVLAAMSAELDHKEEVVGIHGCLTDISRQKWAENVQIIRFEQEIQMKRQQELFIDMTSHEMRNPLSAIVQSADSIIASLKPTATSAGDRLAEGGSPDTIDIDGAVDAAQTIVFCAQHQKRISDDVWVFSKLNSNLLPVTPVNVGLTELVSSWQGRWKPEFEKNGIDLVVEAQASARDQHGQPINVDADKLLQILTNLVFNASKLIEAPKKRQRKSKAQKKITIRYGISPSSSLEELSSITYFEKDFSVTAASRPSDSESESTHQATYCLYMAVEDPSSKLTLKEAQDMFRGFSDVVPKTHNDLGGSGLGLLISKRLVELQGGALGMSGQSFVFYVKCVRSESQTSQEDLETASVRPKAANEAMSMIQMPRPTIEITRSNSPQPKPNTSTPIKSETPARKSPEGQKPNALGTLSSSSHGESLHVLLVEDNLVNQKVLSKQLSRLGYKVSVANHGAEALDHLEKTILWNPFSSQSTSAASALSPGSNQSARDAGYFDGATALAAIEDSQDLLSPTSQTFEGSASSRGGSDSEATPLNLVLMDIEMPVMDGLTCVRSIRRLQDEGRVLSHLPTIAVTANARPEQVKEAMSAGMDGVVCKPFRIPELVKEIEVVLTRLASNPVS